jgi:cbb3-type cytochrome oxidase subunit 1
VFAATYYIIPKVTGRKIYSKKLAVLHFWLTLIGWILMLVSLTIAGLIQAAGWHFSIAMDQWAFEQEPYMLVRFISGLMITLGQVFFLFNIYKTVFSEDAEPAPHSPTGIDFV